ncbi:helix-turn-helix transcriptional regulator [Kineococcus sp. SYSU DK001]|uniref:helix-turn-helix transcriptional regulator n=1 Tax=Kineococcus sp. SYSU DK001 TaxID=3383122 RepID=UPI003D7E0D21
MEDDTNLVHVTFGGHDGADVGEWTRHSELALLGEKVWPLGDSSTFSGFLTRRTIGDLLVTDYQTSPFAGRFAPTTAAADYVQLSRVSAVGGEWTRLRDGRRFEAGGALSMFDGASLDAYEQWRSRRSTTLHVPKSALRERGLRWQSYHLPRFLDSSTTAHVLAAMLPPLLSGPAISAGESFALRAAVLDLMAGLRPQDVLHSSQAVSAAMRSRIETWVERAIHTGPITPADAAAAHGVSVRSLHRLFAGSDRSFSGLVREKRLEAARNDLATGTSTIQGVAARWGYSDVSHFCREFKRAYGTTASQFRADRLAPVAVGC